MWHVSISTSIFETTHQECDYSTSSRSWLYSTADRWLSSRWPQWDLQRPGHVLYPVLPFSILFPLLLHLRKLRSGGIMSVKDKCILTQILILAEFADIWSNGQESGDVDEVVRRDLRGIQSIVCTCLMPRNFTWMGGANGKDCRLPTSSIFITSAPLTGHVDLARKTPCSKTSLPSFSQFLRRSSVR